MSCLVAERVPPHPRRSASCRGQGEGAGRTSPTSPRAQAFRGFTL